MRLSRERHSHRPVPVPTAEDLLVQTAEVNFICPQCGSFYEVVRAKALPDGVDRRIACPTCTGPLPAREAHSCSNTFSCEKPTADGIARGSAPSLANDNASWTPARAFFRLTAHVGGRSYLYSESGPRSPYRPCAATAPRARLAAGMLQSQPRAPQCDPRQREAGVKAFAPYRSRVCCFARQHQQLC